jgi:hypothetical protein
MMSEVFISYGRKDKPFVHKLRDQLNEAGFSVWHDEDIDGGQNWFKTITEEIRKCRVLLVVISAESANSQFVALECGMALALNKHLIPLSIDTNVATLSYIKHIQSIPYKDDSAIDKIIDDIQQYLAITRFWYRLFTPGIDIGTPLETYSDVEAVNGRTIGASLDFYNLLLARLDFEFDPYKKLNIIPTRQFGNELNTSRNWILLGGPGGFPFVRDLLITWLGNSENIKNGYRFVTEKGRFLLGPHLRDSEDGQTGIERIQDGQVTKFYKSTDPSRGIDGINHSLIFTKGFGRNYEGSHKVIILAPYNRSVLNATATFLFDDTMSQNWMNQIKELDQYSQTLLSFRYNTGLAPNLLECAGPYPLLG